VSQWNWKKHLNNLSFWAEDIMSKQRIKPGDFFLDCFDNPCICTRASYVDDTIEGISLIDGSAPRGCSPRHCVVDRISMTKAFQMKADFDEWYYQSGRKTKKQDVVDANKEAVADMLYKLAVKICPSRG